MSKGKGGKKKYLKKSHPENSRLNENYKPKDPRNSMNPQLKKHEGNTKGRHNQIAENQ